jgi:hypothetical protein
MKVNVPPGMVVSLFAQALIVRRHLSGFHSCEGHASAID